MENKTLEYAKRIYFVAVAVLMYYFLTEVIDLGLYITYRHAFALVLAASGYKTAQWVAYMLKCEFSTKCPAAIVKEHGDFILLLDKEAASCVPQCYLG